MFSSSTSLKLAVTAGAVTNLAGAAIVSADFSSSPLSISNGSGTIYIDFETASASLSEIAGYDAGFIFSGSNPEHAILTTNSPIEPVGYNYYARKLSFGATIGSTTGYSVGVLENGAGGFWNSPNDGFGYLGLKNTNTGNQAWLYINFNDATNTITLLGMGYNNSGALTAGQTAAVPEPAAATALAALLAGGVAAFQRRRRAA